LLAAGKCNTDVNIAIAVLITQGPLLTDCILLLRVVAVYPPSITPRRKFGCIIAFPMLAKAVRFASYVMFYIEAARSADKPVGNYGIASTLLWNHIPWAKVELFMAVFDNLSVLYIRPIESTLTSILQICFYIVYLQIKERWLVTLGRRRIQIPLISTPLFLHRCED
jgi:hypothetical protein